MAVQGHLPAAPSAMPLKLFVVSHLRPRIMSLAGTLFIAAPIGRRLVGPKVIIAYSVRIAYWLADTAHALQRQARGKRASQLHGASAAPMTTVVGGTWLAARLQLRNDARRQHFSEFDAPLVKTVDRPRRALGKYAMLIKCHQLAEHLRS